MSASQDIQELVDSLDFIDQASWVIRLDAENKFQQELATTYLVSGVSKVIADAIYHHAYQQGQPKGYDEIESIYCQAAALVNLTVATYTAP